MRDTINGNIHRSGKLQTPGKSAYLKIIFLISQPKHMFKLIGKEIHTFLGAKTILIWTYVTIDKRRSKKLETVFLIAICRQSGDKWQSKTLFLTIFDLRLSMVLTFSIAAYPVC